MDATGGGEWVTYLRVKLNEGYPDSHRHYDGASNLLFFYAMGRSEVIAFVAGDKFRNW